MPRRPIGTLIRKIQCQLAKVVMKPPTGGPITGPIRAGVVTQAMAATSSRRLIERTSTMRPTGVIIAPPMPCRMRAKTKSVSELDSAQAIEPSDEHGDGRAEHGAGAEAVGGPARGGDEDGERQQIGGDGELERQRIGADIGGDRRQRGGDHRRVHVLHEQRDRDDQRDDAVTAHGAGKVAPVRKGSDPEPAGLERPARAEQRQTGGGRKARPQWLPCGLHGRHPRIDLGIAAAHANDPRQPKSGP